MESQSIIKYFGKVTCPGKVIITGEHSVVYFKPALVMAINLKTTADFRIIERQDQFLKFEIKSRQDTIIDLLIDKQQLNQPSKEDLKEAQLIYHILSDFTNEIQQLKEGYTIQILIESTIPIGAGLGSSAAYSVALSASIYLSIKLILKQQIEEFKPAIQSYADFQEKLIHTNPSGVDVTISMNGAMLKFVRGQTIKENQITLIKKGLGNTSMILVNTNQQRNSKKTIEAVMKFKNDDIENFNKVLDQIGQVSETIVQKVDQGESFLEQVEENQLLLSQLGVSCESIEKVINIMKKYDVIGKLTGAGGGGCVIGFYQQNIKLEDLVNELQTEGFTAYKELAISQNGLEIDLNNQKLI